MRHVPIAEAKDKFSEIVSAAEAGEEIVITRHGREAVRMIPAASDAQRIARRRAALDALMEHRNRMQAEGRTASLEEMIAWKNEGRP